MSSVTFRGVTVSCNDVLRVLSVFDKTCDDDGNVNSPGYPGVKPDLKMAARAGLCAAPRTGPTEPVVFIHGCAVQRMDVCLANHGEIAHDQTFHVESRLRSR